MAKVSVIIPIYGVEKYIERCAVSLFEQTLTDIEYIFVNDCTKDRSMEILNGVILKYPHRKAQVQIVNMPVNSGLPTVRKVGLQYATGEYIAHCDSDDWVDTSAYEKLYNTAKQYDSDIVFCDFYKSDGINHCLVPRIINTNSSKEVITSLSKIASWNVWSCIVRRGLYSDNKIEYPTNNNGEDFALMFQLIHYAQSFRKIDYPLYFYYLNPQSITNAPTEDAYIKRYSQLLSNTELVIDFIKHNLAILEYKHIIDCYKLYCRTKLSPLTHKQKYRLLWKTTYPELNFMDIVTNPIMKIKTKLHYIAVYLRVYHLIHKNKL